MAQQGVVPLHRHGHRGRALVAIFEEDDLFKRAVAMSEYFLDAVFSLKGHPMVHDIRAQTERFWNGLHVKFAGDTGIIAPMCIAQKAHIDERMDKFRKTLDALA